MQHGRRLHTGMNPRKQGLLGVTVQAGYHSHTLLVGTQMVQSLWEIIQQYLIKLNVQLPSDPSFTSSPVYSREMYTHIHTKACPWVFTAASYVTDPHWKQSKCSSAGERTSCDKPTLWVGLREPIKDVEFHKEALSNLNLMGQGEDMIFQEPLGIRLPHRSCQ